MILAKWNDEIEMTINSGDIVTSDEHFENIFKLVSADVPSPSEGDLDMVYFKRMKKYYPDLEIIKYIPMEMEDNVVY